MYDVTYVLVDNSVHYVTRVRVYNGIVCDATFALFNKGSVYDVTTVLFDKGIVCAVITVLVDKGIVYSVG